METLIKNDQLDTDTIGFAGADQHPERETLADWNFPVEWIRFWRAEVTREGADYNPELVDFIVRGYNDALRKALEQEREEFLDGLPFTD